MVCGSGLEEECGVHLSAEVGKGTGDITELGSAGLKA